MKKLIAGITAQAIFVAKMANLRTHLHTFLAKRKKLAALDSQYDSDKTELTKYFTTQDNTHGQEVIENGQ